MVYIPIRLKKEISDLAVRPLTGSEQEALVAARALELGEETPMNALAIGSRKISRRAFLHSSVIGISGIALTGCMSSMDTRNDVEIVRKTITVPNLPAAFRGKTIALLSDIHSSPFLDLDGLKNVAALLQSQNADMIVMPGDFVTSHRNEALPLVEAFTGLTAPLGVFGSTGNHDFYVDADLVSAAVESAGIKMLRNDNISISIGDDKLYLMGIDDNDYGQIDDFVEGRKASHVEAAFANIPESAATILLCHKPYKFDQYAKTNVGLVLSGHTHGGQVVFGRIGGTVLSISSVATRFIEGLFRADEEVSDSQLYVTRGIGVVGLPIRVNCPPEITMITLS